MGQGVFLCVPGVVKEVYVREGAEVESGQILVRLDDATAKLQLLEMEAERAGIERQLIESRANKDASAVRRLTISKVSISAKVRKARDDLSNTLITAPRSGRILTTRPSELVGRQLNIGDEILRLVNLDRPTIVIEIEEEAVILNADGKLFPGMTGSAKIMTPQSSPVARLLRRIKNTFVFWFGI